MQWSKEQSLRSVTDRKECCFISFIPFHFWKRRESMNVFTRLNWIHWSSGSLNSESYLLCLDWHFALKANTMNESTLPTVAIKINKFMWLSSIILGSWLSSVQFISFQSLSRVRLLATPWTAARQASLSITKPMSIVSVMPSNNLILCHPLLLPPSIFLSIGVFSNEPALRIRWPKYWSFSFNISPSNEHPGLISFRMDWLDLLAVQGTLKSLFQHHSSKASIFRCPAFFIVQLSHPYMTTGKTIALTRWTFVGKVMSLLFNMLSRLVITFLPTQ